MYGVEVPAAGAADTAPYAAGKGSSRTGPLWLIGVVGEVVHRPAAYGDVATAGGPIGGGDTNTRPSCGCDHRPDIESSAYLAAQADALPAAAVMKISSADAAHARGWKSAGRCAATASTCFGRYPRRDRAHRTAERLDLVAAGTSARFRSFLFFEAIRRGGAYVDGTENRLLRSPGGSGRAFVPPSWLARCVSAAVGESTLRAIRVKIHLDCASTGPGQGMRGERRACSAGIKGGRRAGRSTWLSAVTFGDRALKAWSKIDGEGRPAVH